MANLFSSIADGVGNGINTLNKNVLTPLADTVGTVLKPISTLGGAFGGTDSNNKNITALSGLSDDELKRLLALVKNNSNTTPTTTQPSAAKTAASQFLFGNLNPTINSSSPGRLAGETPFEYFRRTNKLTF